MECGAEAVEGVLADVDEADLVGLRRQGGERKDRDGFGAAGDKADGIGERAFDTGRGGWGADDVDAIFRTIDGNVGDGPRAGGIDRHRTALDGGDATRSGVALRVGSRGDEWESRKQGRRCHQDATHPPPCPDERARRWVGLHGLEVADSHR